MAKHGYKVQGRGCVLGRAGHFAVHGSPGQHGRTVHCRHIGLYIGGQLVERSKDALDEIYDASSAECARIQAALEVYGSDKFAEEFKYCVDQVLATCKAGEPTKLRNVIFKGGTTNAFPSIFAVLLIAFHELVIKDGMVVSDFGGVKDAISGLAERIDTGRKATSVAERRKNIDAIKGLIGGSFVKANVATLVSGNHATTDVDSVIRRSEIELADTS